MKVRSTGLGNVQLTCELLSFKDGEKGGLILTLHAVKPVRWIIRGMLERDDIIAVVKALLLRPQILFRIIKLLLFKPAAKSDDNWLSEKELQETLKTK